MLFIVGCKEELTSLEFDIKCKSKGKYPVEFYVDENFVGSMEATCRGFDRFNVKLEPGIHNIRISVENQTIYIKEIKILGTDDWQKIAVDIP